MMFCTFKFHAYIQYSRSFQLILQFYECYIIIMTVLLESIDHLKIHNYYFWLKTVQLECFVRSVHLIRVFEWSSVCKCMSFN